MICVGDKISYTPFNCKGWENTIVTVPDITNDRWEHWFDELKDMLKMPNKCNIVVIP